MRFWLGWVFALGLLLLALVWGFSQWNLRYYTDYIGDRMELLVELRRGAVTEYFDTAQAELYFWSRNEGVIAAQEKLNNLWQAGGEELRQELVRLYITENPNPEGFLLNLDDAEDGSIYSELHAGTHPVARLFVTHRGYYDFFLIGPEGDIYYTVEKEADFASNLVNGPWKDSGLARVFAEARKGQAAGAVAISDMQAYGPSEGAPAVFIGTAMHNEAGEFIGVLALQLPTDRILGIMGYVSGMGDTGETYLVGEDLLMRSDSRFSEDSTVLLQRVESPTVSLALAGEQGRGLITDYRGVEVMSASLPMDVGQHRWAVLAEIDQSEVAEFAASQRPPLGGALMLIYGLSLWSVWYWRGRKLPDDPINISNMEMADSDGGGIGA